MAHIIRIKRSGEPGAVPASLAYGELAFNFADGILYIGGPDGNPIQVTTTDQVVIPPEMLDAAPPPRPRTPPQPVPPPQQPGYTTTGVRRRLLPFE